MYPFESRTTKSNSKRWFKKSVLLTTFWRWSFASFSVNFPVAKDDRIAVTSLMTPKKLKWDTKFWKQNPEENVSSTRSQNHSRTVSFPGNWKTRNGFCQPRVHTVMDRTSARRARVLPITVWTSGWHNHFWFFNFLEEAFSVVC